MLTLSRHFLYGNKVLLQSCIQKLTTLQSKYMYRRRKDKKKGVIFVIVTLLSIFTLSCSNEGKWVELDGDNVNEPFVGKCYIVAEEYLFNHINNPDGTEIEGKKILYNEIKNSYYVFLTIRTKTVGGEYEHDELLYPLERRGDDAYIIDSPISLNEDSFQLDLDWLDSLRPKVDTRN